LATLMIVPKGCGNEFKKLGAQQQNKQDFSNILQKNILL
jgi:hypothetical protein